MTHIPHSKDTYSPAQLAELNPDNFSSIIDCYQDAKNQFADRTSYVCLGVSHTFAEIDRLSAAFGCYLLNECGLNMGDRVAIQLPNITQYPIAAWGAIRAGLIVVNTNPMYTAREQTHQFNDSGARALVVLKDLLPITEQVLPKTKIEKVIVTNAMDLFDFSQVMEVPENPDFIAFNQALIDGADKELPKLEMQMSDIAILQYTGGTTGPSKGAMLSHGNLYSSMRLSRKSVVLAPPDHPEIVIAPLPLYHIFCFTASITSSFLNGGTSVLIPDPREMDSLIDVMKSFPFTAMISVNTLLAGMMAHPEFDEVDFSHVKGTIVGGTALVKEIGQEWTERTGTQIFEGYGLSETSATSTCNRPEASELGTVGLPMLHTQIKTMNEEGEICATGEAGEVCIRGPQVMIGYWQNDQATAGDIDEEGWFRSGDIGVIQENGMLKIVDRIKDMIIVSGFNVYPNEVEEVIYGHPDIVECAAIGVPNEQTGEAIKLFVVSKNPDLSAEDIIAFSRNELTAYKVPRQIEFADDLPKSPAGKILRRELREIQAS